MDFEIDTLVHYYELLLQRLEDLEGQMQQVRSKSIDEAAIKVKIGSFTCPAATGYKAVTGVGFKPRYVEFMIGQDLTENVRYAHGWVNYNGNCFVVGFASKDDLQYTKETVTYCVYIINEAGEGVVLATWVSMDNDGFTLNYTATTSAYTLSYKAVR